MRSAYLCGSKSVVTHMSKQLIFILGGARSGKSAFAEQLAEKQTGKVLYVATAEAGDEEMAERIEHHKAARPDHWQTLEASREIGKAIQAWKGKPDLVVIDCLTLLASNIITALPETASQQEAEAALDLEIEALLSAYRDSSAQWIIISNEVGLGLVPPYPLGRTYRDSLGRANQHLARMADRVIFMLSGIPVTVK
jgi:adenosylcobinamide kinase/adenosylcobinamide-phosphate guanylyltransferase